MSRWVRSSGDRGKAPAIVSVGKTGFTSHTKPTVEATQGSTSFMRDNI